MAELLPLRGWVVDGEAAARVVTPPYDQLSPAERADWARTHPASFLTVLPEHGPPVPGDEEQRLATARGRLQRMVEESFRPLAGPAMLIYRLVAGAHQQTGVVVDLPISAYDSGEVREHETTRPDRVAQMTRFLELVGVASSPVSITYRARAHIDRLVRRLTAQSPPAVDAPAPDGVRQQLWVVRRRADVAALQEAFTDVGGLTITDGHHRAAAQSRWASRHGDDTARRLLSVLFPHDQLRVEAFDRVVRPVPRPDVLAAVRDRGIEVATLVRPARPSGPGRVTAVLRDDWWELTLPSGREGTAGLDTVVLQREVLTPVFGVADPTADGRLQAVPARSPGDLAARAGPDGAGFALHPVDIDTLLAVAARGEVMPPKSTYVTPKVRSGLLVVPRRDDAP